MAPLLNPSPVLGLWSPCPFFNQDIYFLRDIWQCLGTFLVVTTGECANIQWVKDSDLAKCPTVHMTVPTAKNVNECWRCKSLLGPPSLSGKHCSQWASPLLTSGLCSNPAGDSGLPWPPCFTGYPDALYPFVYCHPHQLEGKASEDSAPCSWYTCSQWRLSFIRLYDLTSNAE